MKYSPKKIDTVARLVYSALLIVGFILMSIPFSGYVSIFTDTLAVFCIVASLYFFIRYECNTYEYILIERNSTLDFYVNKLTGKRGAYVCYFPLTDAQEIGKFESREKIIEKHGKVGFYKYIQNPFNSKNVHYILFRDKESLDCILFEPSEEMVRLISENILSSTEETP